MGCLEVQESQVFSRQLCQEIFCETGAPWKVIANHSYIPAVLFIIPRHAKSGVVFYYTLQTLCPSVCPSALRFRALTLVPFDLFSSNFA